MILLNRIRIFGRRSGRIKESKSPDFAISTTGPHSGIVKSSTPDLTQIRKHIPAVLVIPDAGTLKRIKFSISEGAGGNRQCNGLVQPLLAGKADTSFLSLICMFVAIATPTFYTSPQRWVLATVWYKITDNHFTLFSHDRPMPSLREAHFATKPSPTKQGIASSSSQ